MMMILGVSLDTALFDIDQAKGICLWRLDVDGYYATQCGQAFTAFAEGLNENHYRYCPWCGRAIVEAHDDEEQSEDE